MFFYSTYIIYQICINHIDAVNEEVFALNIACGAGNLRDVKYLVEERNVNPNTYGDEYKMYPLHCASFCGHLHIVRYLVEERNCNIDCREESGGTPLHSAAAWGKVDIMKYLITEKHCDPMCTDKDGWTPLHKACAEGKLDVIKYLLEDKKVDSSRRNKDGATPLHLAVLYGYLDVIKYLIEEQKCDKECKDNYGQTPLSIAVVKGRLNIIKYLIEEMDCNPTHNCESGMTLLHLACHSGEVDTVRYIAALCEIDPSCQDMTGSTPLHVAVRCGTLEVVKYLIEEMKCNAECRQKYLGYTPLSIAINKGKLDVVEYLIGKCDCDPMCSDIFGLTPLHLACSSDRLDIVKYMIENGKVNLSYEAAVDGITPLHVATQLDVVKYLVEEKHCNVEHRTKKQKTLLHFAAEKGKLDIVQYLIQEKSCKPTCEDKNGDTILHLAGSPDVAVYLIEELKFDPSCPNKLNSTPLHNATARGCLPVVKLLVEKYNCDISVKNSEGLTAAQLAIKHKEFPTFGYLSDMRKKVAQIKPYIKTVKQTGQVLGSGTYGKVIELLTSGGVIVAGKIFRLSATAQMEVASKVEEEMVTMMQLSHPNVVKCKGLALLPDQSPLPVLLMERLMTSLHAYLLDPVNSNLPVEKKMSFLLDTARGLDYLHSHTPPIIHRDLTAKNVLLDSQLRAKITDFGNSRILDLDPNATPGTMTSLPGTLDYMPPEAMGGGVTYDPSLDVFSLGHLALFTVIQTHVRPLLPSTYTNSEEKLVARSEVERRMQFVEKAEKIPGSHSLLKVVQQCLQNKPSKRPATGKLVEMLQKIMETAGE